MKKLLLAILAIAGVAQTVQAMDMQQALMQKFDLAQVLDKAKEFTDRIQLTGDMDQDIKTIIVNAQESLGDIPNRLLEVAQDARMTATVKRMIRENAPLAIALMNKVRAFIEYPALAVDLLKNVVYPNIIVKLTPEIRDAGYQLINFLYNNQDAVAKLAQENLAPALQVVNEKLKMLAEGRGMKAAEIRQTINDMKMALSDIYPAVAQFIQEHRGKIEELVMSLKNMNLTASAQDLIDTLQTQMPLVQRMAGV